MFGEEKAKEMMCLSAKIDAEKEERRRVREAKKVERDADAIKQQLRDERKVWVGWNQRCAKVYLSKKSDIVI